MNILKAVRVGLLASLLLVASRLHAEDACQPESEQCVPVGQWSLSLGIGAGMRTNPVIENDDIPIVFLPGISYYGERVFWETDTVGYTLIDGDTRTFNIIGTVSYEQTFFNTWGVGNFGIEGGSGPSRGTVQFRSDLTIVNDPLPGDLVGGEPGSGGPVGPPGEELAELDFNRLHDRDLSVLGGFEYSFFWSRGNLGIQALQDVSGVHDGQQLRIALSQGWQWSRQRMMVSLGAEWQDSKTLHYYFGLDADEVPELLVYEVGADWSHYIKTDWRLALSKHWELRGVIHHRWFGDEVSNSPLMETDSTTAVFFGGVYHF